MYDLGNNESGGGHVWPQRHEHWTYISEWFITFAIDNYRIVGGVCGGPSSILSSAVEQQRNFSRPGFTIYDTVNYAQESHSEMVLCFKNCSNLLWYNREILFDITRTIYSSSERLKQILK